MEGRLTLTEAVALYQDALALAADTARCPVCRFAVTERVRLAEHELRLAAMNHEREKVLA